MKEYQSDGHIYQVECVHNGQYHPYGDTFRVFEVYTDDTDPSNILHVMGVLYGYNVPLLGVFAPKSLGEYFQGYCEIEPIDGGFKYTKCEPYTD